MAIKIYPYKMGSGSAKALAIRLGAMRVFPDKAYHHKDEHLVVNWGASQTPSWTFPDNGLNWPESVEVASNKLKTFSYMLGEIITPAYTTNPDSAVAWFDTGATRVYCRRKLSGHSGEGIIVANAPDELVAAPLYVKGIVGYRDEFRLLVFQDKVIDTQMKKKKVGADTNDLIRNHQNGYVYCRDNIPPISGSVFEAAINSVAILGLDFGAVDVIVLRDDPEDYYVLEVNTAPGLEGTTLEVYANAIEEYYNEWA